MAEVVSTGVSHMCNNSTVSVKDNESTGVPNARLSECGLRCIYNETSNNGFPLLRKPR